VRGGRPLFGYQDSDKGRWQGFPWKRERGLIRRVGGKKFGIQSLVQYSERQSVDRRILPSPLKKSLERLCCKRSLSQKGQRYKDRQKVGKVLDEKI